MKSIDENRLNRIKMGWGTVSMIVISMIFQATAAHASNWLMLQGTEPPDAGKLKVWGFIQPLYSTTQGTNLEAGPFSGQEAVFNQAKPDLKTNQQFQIFRARAGFRGKIDNKVNYFFLGEFGNNGITRREGGSAQLSDASITLNIVPGARVRIGQFKTPGSEEGLQAIHTHTYIYFANAWDQLVLERFYDGDGSDTSDANRPNGPVGAYRDIGIQVFDTFKMGDWEHSYAFMVGNGNGITRGDNDENKDLYAYLATEWVLGGKGPRRQGVKLFVWTQDGKRTLTATGAGEYDRSRSGAGIAFRKSKYRALFEFVAADGMIFNGTDAGAIPGSVSNDGSQVASFNITPDDKADGWYADFGYKVLPQLELDVRYDVLNRGTDSGSASERKFETITLGGQYFLTKKTRITVNYEIRDAEAPNLAPSAVANQVLDAMDDRIALQVLTVF